VIVILVGSYRNAGDYLIGFRARQLLSLLYDSDIVAIDRKAVGDHEYETFNRAKAVILCGGPAYQKNTYPDIYSLNLDRIKVPVIPFGLGYKDRMESKKFMFSKSSLKFVKEIHRKVYRSSARDIGTVQILAQNGIKNVVMTGCPAWYDPDKMYDSYIEAFPAKHLIFSAPANINKAFLRVLSWGARRFSDVRRSLSFHHGYFPKVQYKYLLFTLKHLYCAAFARKLGYEVRDISGGHEKMTDLYNDCSIHIGYRVHAHIYCLSQRQASLLISEDMRGVSQSISLKQQVISATSQNLRSEIESKINLIAQKEPAFFADTFSEMRTRYLMMQDFISHIGE
jgi:hypothetical protein